MLRLAITTTIPSKKGTGMIWFVLETDLNDMVDVHNRLVTDGCIRGTKVMTADGVDGDRVVTAREPFIIGKGAVGTIAPCHFNYREVA
jgi:hypothetical protein